MPDDRTHEVTRLLNEWQSGDAVAVDKLIPYIYTELKYLAAGYLRGERKDHTLQPTALVHEAYIKLVGQRAVRWRNRSHFLGIAAQAMRRILVDHARRHHAAKRAGGQMVTLDEGVLVAEAASVDVVALNEALDRLSALDERQGRVVELRFFGGLGVEEAAEVLAISPATVKREWRIARAWLRRELADETETGAARRVKAE